MYFASRAGARIDAGISLGNRSLRFTQREFAQGPKPFQSAPGPASRRRDP